jgi:nucleotide-binding universal stress UspA family protein
MTMRSAIDPVKILLAVDGSEHSQGAAHLVRDLPLPAGSRVTVVGVLEPRRPPGRAALMAASDQAVQILDGLQAEVQTGLLHGDPTEELARFARETQADLIVLGAQGLRATLGVFLGGVAQGVVENAPVPVLVVRSPHREIRRVLVAADGSDHSRWAARYLAHFPLEEEVQVLVMHVLPARKVRGDATAGIPSRVEAPPPTPQEDSLSFRQAESEEQAGMNLLGEVESILKEGGFEPETRLAQGDPAEELIRTAREESVDLIVAGSRGLGAVQGWLLGSVSRQLLHSASIPVLIVRKPGEKME